jgi:hypothetical protein
LLDPFSKKIKPVLKAHVFVRIIYNRNSNKSSASTLFNLGKTTSGSEKNKTTPFFTTDNLINNKYQTASSQKNKNRGLPLPPLPRTASPSGSSDSASDENVVLECILIAPVFENVISEFLYLLFLLIIYSCV